MATAVCTDRSAFVPVRHAVAALLALVLAAGALFVLVRILAGPERPALNSAAVVLAGVALAILSAALHAALSRRRSSVSWLIPLVVSTGVVTAAGALALSAGWWPAAASVLLFVVAEEGLAWSWRTGRLGRRRPATGWQRQPDHADETGSSLSPDSSADRDLEQGPRPATGRVVQQLTVTHDGNGRDRAVGWQRVNFPPGARSAVLHVAFCPLMQSIPQLQFAQRSGPEVEIKPALVQPFGIRLDLRLRAPASRPTEVVVQFEAIADRGDDSSGHFADA